MKKEILHAFMMVCVCLAPFALAAQTLQVTGSVTSAADGRPLPGVTVTVQGTNTATSTDDSGRFQLVVPRAGSILVFQQLGMTTQLITVRTAGLVDVALAEDLSTLEEVVVIGYGTQKKSVVTGAISSVKSADLENMPVMRIEHSLQGRTSGLTITADAGQPGAASTVRVRGTTTINNSNPLYIVDGIQIGGGIEYLNQSDIESIEVLKDAASAAIYGARAANGVIIVTTKQGKAGKIAIGYNGYAGSQQPWRKLDLLNATEYATLRNEASVAGGGGIVFDTPQDLGEGTDWQSEVFTPNALLHNHELSLSAGSDKSTYYSSFGLFEQDGIVAKQNSNFQRFTARINSSHNVTSAITVGQNVSYSRIKSVGIGVNGEFGTPLNRAINIDPITPVIETNHDLLVKPPYTNPNIVRAPNGYPYGISEIVTSEILNPLAAIATQQGQGWSDKIVGNAFVEVKPVAGLKLRSSIGVDLAFWGDEGFTPLYYLNSTNQVTLNSYTRNNNKGLMWLWEGFASYDISVDDHNFEALVGLSSQNNSGQLNGNTKQGLPVTHLRDASMNFSVPQTNQFASGSEYQDRLASMFARFNYNYGEKYLLSATLRRDGSSKFGPNNKFGYFPSVSVGWVLSKEDFAQESESINFLKFRASYGINGNNQIGDFRYLPTIGRGRNYSIGQGGGQQLIIGASPNALSNPDLRWEETAQTNLGLDMVLFEHYNITLDWYKKKTKDMLLDIAVPYYTGVLQGPVGNVADMENSGIEIEAGYRKVFGGITVALNANASYLRNRVTYLGDDKTFLTGQVYGPQGLEITRTMLNQPIGALFGYRTDGLFQNMDEVAGYVNNDNVRLQPNAQPGDIRFVDVNGDGVIDANDRTIIGDPTPDWSYGFTASIQWRNVDFMVFGQGIAGNQVFQAFRRFDLPTANYSTEALGRWTGEGTSNYFPRLVAGDPNNNLGRSSDFFVKDASYFRFKTVQIGYTIKQGITHRVGLNKLRIYATGHNLFTFTKYNGYDPEIGGGSYGVDRGIYPQARMYMVGLNLGF